MAVQKYNRRRLIKRSTTPGVIPTIPSTIGSPAVVDANDHTLGGWLDTDIYVGEFFLNSADDRLWIRTENDIIELDINTNNFSFLGLTDTPANYTGFAGYYLVVNEAENAIEFSSVPVPTTLLDLNDTPDVYEDEKVLVSAIGSPFNFRYEDYISMFSQLTDVPAFDGNSEYLLRVNSAEEAIEYVNGSSLFMDLFYDQSITGIKTFEDIIITNSIVTPSLTLGVGSPSGLTINDIISDTSLAGASDSNIATTLAIKTYIDNKVITAVTGDYVDKTSNETIAGDKTFSNVITANAGANISGDVSVTGGFSATAVSTGDIYLTTLSAQYFGDPEVDGSYRFFINGEGNLQIEKRESGVWVYKANF